MYLLDSNAFLTPANSYYSLNICSGYWDWIRSQFNGGSVSTILQVKKELCAKDDAVKNWIEFHLGGSFCAIDSATTKSMQELANWAQSGHYEPHAIAEFLSKADSFLVARAKAYSATVVTLETRAKGSKHRIKIPDACDAHGVTCMTPFEMLAKEGVTLKV